MTLSTQNLSNSKISENNKHESCDVQLIAHDLRSPLMSLRLLVKEYLETSYQFSKTELAEHIYSRFQEIIGQIVQTKQYKSQSIIPMQILLHRLIEEKHILYPTLEIELASQNINDAVIVPYANDLLRVLSNLIDNSAAAGCSKVIIDMIGSKGKITYMVQDNGCGLSPKLINEFKRDHKIASTKINGNGLGLFSAHRLLEPWGASMTIESILNLGTKISITL